jgi:hypothetical protein
MEKARAREKVSQQKKTSKKKTKPAPVVPDRKGPVTLATNSVAARRLAMMQGSNLSSTGTQLPPPKVSNDQTATEAKGRRSVVPEPAPEQDFHFDPFSDNAATLDSLGATDSTKQESAQATGGVEWGNAGLSEQGNVNDVQEGIGQLSFSTFDAFGSESTPTKTKGAVDDPFAAFPSSGVFKDATLERSAPPLEDVPGTEPGQQVDLIDLDDPFDVGPGPDKDIVVLLDLASSTNSESALSGKASDILQMFPTDFSNSGKCIAQQPVAATVPRRAPLDPFDNLFSFEK